jgi:chitodextrinase
MKKSIASAIAFAAVAMLLCVTCGDNAASPYKSGRVDAFAGKFNRNQSGNGGSGPDTSGDGNSNNNGGTQTAPDTPASVSGTAVSSNSITINWSSVSGATGYRIYRSTSYSGSYAQIGITSATSYTDDGLSANTAYYYKVQAYNDAGNSSQPSLVSATTKNNTSNSTPTAPGVPSGVVASATSSSSITVSWFSVSGATGYYVYSGTSAYGNYTKIGTSTSTTYTNSGLLENTTYYYKVYAYNSIGVSDESYYASATTKSNINIPTDKYMCLYPSGDCWDDQPDRCNENWGWVFNGGQEGPDTYCAGGTYNTTATTNRIYETPPTGTRPVLGCCFWAESGVYDNLYTDMAIIDCMSGSNTFWYDTKCGPRDTYGNVTRPGGEPTYVGSGEW